ncbi:MAG: hypothetical protein HUU21_10095 [Polyangiaceae bacterium]|nr:hypothetical protein [Polyangiaceae bacterium]
MADPPPYPDPGDDTGVGPDRESSTSTPRWVKVSGLITVIMVLLFVVVHLAGGGFRGHTMPSSVKKPGVQQP